MKQFIFLFLLLISNFLKAQKSTFSHRIEHTENLSRSAVNYNLSYHFMLQKIDLGIGTGFNWNKLVSAKFYQPYINANAYYFLVKNEKMKIGLGLDYYFDWHLYPANKSAYSYRLYYGYELILGKTWCFVNRLGIGGQYRSDFPKGNLIALDIEFTIGMAYAF